MYRIEVAPGEETVFRTIEELAIGIRNGLVTKRARIYHNASEKWLPIVLHPHYKKALEMPAASPPHAPVTATTPIPTPSRGKAHPPSHPQPQSVVHFPEPRPGQTYTHEPAPVPRIPAPVQSPVIAMQNEVLRDLPVISIPEPLPWTVKRSPPLAPTVQAPTAAMDAPAASAPAVSAPVVPEPVVPESAVPEPVVPEPVVHAPITHAPVVDAPVVRAPVMDPPVVYAPLTHAPLTHAPVTHAPVTHAPVTYAPVTHAPLTHAPVTHAPVTHAPVTHAPVTHAPVTHAPVTHAPAPFAPPQVARSVEALREADDDELPIPRPTARRSRRGSGRPLLLLAAAAALVVGTHFVLTATPSASADPSEAQPAAARGDEPDQPAVGGASSTVTSPAETRPVASRPTEPQRVTVAPARVPMQPGPAFAGSVPARPGADSTPKPKIAVQTPASGPAPDPAGTIEPAPAAIELSLPVPPDSMVPAARTADTTGMKKILRALNGR